MKIPGRTLAFLALVVGLAACTDSPTSTEPVTDPPEDPLAARTLGVMQITLSGITTPEEMSAGAWSVGLATLVGRRAGPGGMTTQGLEPVGEGEGTGIQLEPISTGSFTLGERGNGGVRYLSATFQVRNADTDGLAYGDPLENLTFLAVSTEGTLEQTAVSNLRRFDGSLAPASLAIGLHPAGFARLLAGRLESNEPDVLQVFTEQEAADVEAPAGVTSVFPYGFIGRNVDDGRTLPGGPAEDQFDGVVTFAFRLPLEASAADDPFEISVLVLAVADAETRLTQSLEEQTAAGQAAFEARYAALGATQARILPGAEYPDGIANRRICRVRTAGTAAAPTATLVDEVEWQSFTPNPYAAGGSFIGSASAIEASFSGPVTGGDPETFTVHGLQSGPAFAGQSYSGDGTATIATPAGSFFPGEEVEIGLISGLACGERAARFRVASAPASGSFVAADNHSVGIQPNHLTVADLNGNGVLDLVVANQGVSGNKHISVLLGDGSGGFGPAVSHAVDGTGLSVAVGDFNGNGVLDLAVGAEAAPLAVLLGDGSGGFGPAVNYGVGQASGVAVGDLNGNGVLDLAVTNPVFRDVEIMLGKGNGEFITDTIFYPTGQQTRFVAIGDFNGDGRLDLAVANRGDANVSILLGIGNGHFLPAVNYATGAGAASVAVGDFNGNGVPDLAVANRFGGTVSVLLGNGNGTFAPAVDHVFGCPESVGPPSVAVGDVDGDGRLDLVVANGSCEDSVSVLLGDGSGGFAAPVNHGTGSAPEAVALGDLTGDGRLDIIVANRGSDNVSVLLNGVPE